MSLLSSGEVLAGIGLLVLWWFALRLFRTDKPLSTLSFAFWPCLFLLWIVGALIMIPGGRGSSSP